MIEPARRQPASSDRSARRQDRRAGETGAAPPARARTFADAVNTASTQQRLPASPDGAQLEELLDDLHSTGDVLKDDPTIANIRDYRGKVQEFLAYVVDHSLATTRTQSPGLLSKRKQYTLIQVIDQKLQQLAEQVLARQSERLELVRRIDELHGLLVDLVA